MVDCADGRGEAIVAAIGVEADVVGAALVVVAEAELIVGLEEVAGGEDEFGPAVALEAVAGDDVEDAVCAVADVGGVAAALDFEVVNVLGVDLGGEVAGDVGVGDLYAVDEPCDLMASAHVQHVVGHVCAGDVVGDDGHGVGAVCAGCLGDVDAGEERSGSDGVDVGGLRLGGDVDGLRDAAKLELEVQDGCGIGVEGEGLLEGCKAGVSDGDGVVAEGDVGEGECAVGVAVGGEGEGGARGGKGDVCGGERSVLGVVDDTMELGEDGGARDRGGEEKQSEGG